MMTHDTKELLRDYTRNRSEAAFRALVREHSPVVYGTALRKLGGDRAAAQDVTQEVFTLLARKAHRLESVVLGGWLYRQACRFAANHVRAEVRRKKRESIAMENQDTTRPSDDFLSRELDDAMLKLPEKDRDALILRFFENKEFKALGIALGLSEEAARKRVTRALERLGANLKRRGIAVGTVSLGTAMQGFGSVPVPAVVVARISENALRAGATSGFGMMLSLFIPISAGVAVASLVAGTMLEFHPAEPVGSLAETNPPAENTRHPRPSRFAEKLPEHPTLEQIITEILRIRSGPENALTELRQKALLAKVEIGQIPEFVTLGRGRFDEDGRDEIFGTVLHTWWQKDREATMDFMLEMLKTPQPSRNGFLVRSAFGKWTGEDPAASQRWLFRHWDDPILSSACFGDTLRGSLAKGTVSRLFGDGRIDEIFQFVSRIPKVTDQAEALKPLTGQAGTHGIWNYSEERKDQWRQVYRRLESIPDTACRLSLTRNFWKRVGETSPAEIAGIQSFIAPSDPFAVSLGLLSVTSLPGEEIPNMAGGVTVRNRQVTDLEARMDAATEAGLKAGLTAQAVKDAITDVMRQRGGEDARAWLANDKAGVAQGVKPQMSRGAFRRLLYKSPDEAMAHLDDPSLPPDLKADFQSIATGTP